MRRAVHGAICRRGKLSMGQNVTGRVVMGRVVIGRVSMGPVVRESGLIYTEFSRKANMLYDIIETYHWHIAKKY